jgi:hypothetical protein
MVSPRPSSSSAADADGALDAAVLAVAGLGDAEVERVVHVLPSSMRSTSSR